MSLKSPTEAEGEFLGMLVGVARIMFEKEHVGYSEMVGGIQLQSAGQFVSDESGQSRMAIGGDDGLLTCSSIGNDVVKRIRTF